MLPNTCRLTGESSSNPKTVDDTHEPTVMTAKIAPIDRAIWDGVGRDRLVFSAVSLACSCVVAIAGGTLVLGF
jgi:hypothetical protein